VVTPYPKFANFRQKVLEAVRLDLDRMAGENHTDITFTYELCYPGTRRKGDPEAITFHVVRTVLGESYNVVVNHKPSDLLRKPVQQELFADEPKPQVQDFVAGEGSDLWARLLDGYDGPARPLLLRAEYLGLRDGAFLVRVSDEDDKAWRSIDDSDLQQTGRQLLGLPSFMPSVRRRK